MTAIHSNPADLRSNLSGKTAIITGGANGIGRAAVKMMHGYGANVIIADLMDTDGFALEAELGLRAKYVHANVVSWSEMKTLFETAQETFNGNIDIVVANAGLMERVNFLDDRFDDDGQLLEPDYRVLDVNLKGCLNTTKLAFHYFRKQMSGSLVLVSSISGYFGGRDVLQYKASKHGVTGVMRGTSDHAKDIGARVNSIAPFMVETHMTTGFSKEWLSSGIPGNKPEHVAEAICIAAADADMNGNTLWVSGGKISEVETRLMSMANEWVGEENWKILQAGRGLLSKGYKLPPAPREL